MKVTEERKYTIELSGREADLLNALAGTIMPDDALKTINAYSSLKTKATTTEVVELLGGLYQELDRR